MKVGQQKNDYIHIAMVTIAINERATITIYEFRRLVVLQVTNAGVGYEAVL